MKNGGRRLPKGYDKAGVVTAHRLGDLLPKVLESIQEQYRERPDLIIAAWPDIVGPKLAPMARAVAFSEGVLTVKVNNAPLYSLLCRHEKGRLLRLLRERFPHADIKNLYFRVG